MTKRFRILAVDDDPINLQLINSVLSKEYDLCTALNGYEAIALLAECTPDLILLDVMMPGLNGFEVCKIIKQEERFADIPVIFLTALDTQDGALQGLEIGAIDYLTKPVDFDLLKLRVRNHLALQERTLLVMEQRDLLAQQNEKMREAKAALQLSENRQAKMIANIGDVIVIIDRDGINRYKSPNVEKWFGWKPEELVGANTWENVHPEDLAPAQKIMRTLASHPNEFGTMECRYRCKDGRYKWIEITLINLLHDPEIQGILGNYHDISERKLFEEEKQTLEQQFQQTQKLESLGVLASGIAHDFNNLLAIILGSCFLGQRNTETAGDHLARIETAAVRGAELCRQMLSYAGKSPFDLTQVDLGLLVADMMKMLQASLRESVTIQLDAPPQLPCVIGDGSQLSQVVMNLIINAAEAIGEAQGEILVRLSEVSYSAAATEKDHLGKEIPPGSYVCLQVSDSGCGMNEEIKRRLFEPFYTTKFTGRGLGLSAILGIIKRHNGALQLESQEGQGTTFKVYLPVESHKSWQDEAPQELSASPWRGSGTILLVDDEDSILLAVSTMLQILGFVVMKAANGKEALKLYQEHAAEIDLVLSDMGMPVMNGYELTRELKKINRDLPIIISSGFGETDVLAGIDDGLFAGILHKPYNFQQLKAMLQEVTKTGQ